ncbi:hypothetical protein [Actinacidiphila bryophytorum]|uniref:Uncharacterized protein n=1 Tax=Actinacidiphila bryophytorum TaxID=1436133 RepID=A0A9W4E5C1_9ACTN|nr:hypothetical protein [Actinacidiphila bryophytorum]MBM9438817.1 hypothetical protein [Actinacidiphila bryophytorum]MBN6546794.1 hypothetical protein [Actinacidiphila bryophytorum]CAG7614987.1 conserved hypothetical protein [Actinacidiphila bryophytorum]
MDASTVTAVAATAIASASFAVSISEARATRRHNRHSVKPALELWIRRHNGGDAGLRVCNFGLGPAVVTSTSVALDGVHLGQWTRPVATSLRAQLAEWPHATTVRPDSMLPPGIERSLLYVDDYDPARHGDLWEMLQHRLAFEIRYESLYGGEDFLAVHPAAPM